MLGLRSSPKDNSGFSPAEAVYGSSLSFPGEFLGHPEFPPDVYLRLVESLVSGFSRPPQHHVIPQPQPLPRALLSAEYVFVCDDAFKPLLSPLYRDPNKVLQWGEKFFLQIGIKSDSVSVDKLKPVILSVQVTPAVPPHPNWSLLVPASVTNPPDPAFLQLKKVRFSVLVPAMQLHRNPCRIVQGSPPLFAVLTFWGSNCGYYNYLHVAFIIQSLIGSLGGTDRTNLARDSSFLFSYKLNILYITL